jgi:hypothetical protein
MILSETEIGRNKTALRIGLALLPREAEKTPGPSVAGRIR